MELQPSEVINALLKGLGKVDEVHAWPAVSVL